MVSQPFSSIHPSLCSKGIFLNHQSDNDTPLLKNLEWNPVIFKGKPQLLNVIQSLYVESGSRLLSPTCLLPMTEVFVQFIQNFLSLCSLIYAIFSWETFPSQQDMNRELSDVQAGFRKGRGTRDQIANIRWIIEKTREFQKSIYFCFIDYAKAFDCVDHNKLRKILKEMEIPDHLTCFLRNLYAAQEATVGTGHGTMDWFKIGNWVCRGSILSPAFLTYMQSTSYEMMGWL